MKIPFNFISGFLVGGPLNGDLSISYLDYLKSQLQYNVLAKKKERDLTTYLKAYEYLNGKGYLFEYYLKALKYFYEDLTDLLVIRIRNGELDLTLEIVVEDPFNQLVNFPVVLSDIEMQLSKILNGEDHDLLIAGILFKFSLPEIGLLKSTKALALASILYESSKADPIVKVEPDWR